MKLVKFALTPPIIAISVVIFAALGARADVLEVGPGKTYSDIATAVGAANDYDTVLVYDGTYEITAQIEVKKPITLKSANGAAATEIRHATPTGAMGSKTFVNERCVLIDNADALVDGFAISNGRVASDADPKDNACYGGGVLIYENGGTLANCVVTNCTLGRCMRGGGVAMAGDAAVVTNCTVSGNYTPTVNYPYIHGTGVYMTKGLLVDSVISGNSDPLYAYNEHHGSGVCANGGMVLRCKISGNRCTRGAALECSSGAAIVRDCLIVDNANSMSGGGLGGGLYCTTASAEFHNTVFARNQADQGGGVYVTAGAKFYDCVFQDNMTLGDLSAGAPNWYFSSAATVLSNCWMEVAAEKTKSTDCRIGRVVFADPDNGDWSRPPFAFYRSSKTQVVGKETIFRAVVRDEVDDAVTFRWKVGDGEWSDYSDDPEFTVVFSEVMTVDVSVQAKVGADEQASWTTSVRVAPARIDVAAGGDLAAAVAAAEDGTEIHVAADTYVLSNELVIDKGIRLVGDNGSAVTTIDRKATKSNATNWIIRRAVRINHPDASVEGFTITGGFIYSNITFENDGAGAGVLVGPRGGTLASCRVTGNNSGSVAYGGTLYGAGIGAVGPNSLVTNVTVDGNVTLGWISHGGGVFAAHNARVEDCVISGNQSNGNNDRVGGGVEAKDAIFRRCRISGNAAKKGAGVSAVNASARFENCLIVDNTAVETGGGVNASAGTFVNCTIVGNVAATGGGVYGSGANVKICNAIIQDNSAGADAEWSGANMVFSNVLTSASSVPAKSYGCEGLYPNRAVFAEDGGYTYKSSKSPGVDVGWNVAIPDIESTVDLSLQPRVFKDIVDLGCYEFRTSGDTLIIDFQPKHARSGSMVKFTADGQSASGAALLYRWHFGEETTAWRASGETTHSFSAPGVYDILCEIRIDGEEEVLKTVGDTITVSPDNLYVVSAEEHPDHVPASPYASWETAATNLFDALDLAVGGCTVNVSNGVYQVTNSVEITENITFRGVNGAAVTEIRRVGLGKESSYFNDANVNERVLRIDNADAKVCGFTISGGRVSSETVDIVDSYRGGGVLVDTKGGWLYDCAITNCYLGRVASGGGVAIIGADGVVSNCTISSCLPQLGVYYYYDYGIGAFVKQGVLTHCTFTGFDMRKCVGLTFNRVPGLLLQVTGGRVSHCAFVDNNCTPGGNIGWFCAVDVSGANTVVDNCLIARTVLTKTTESDYGGALRVTSGTVLNCTVADNQCPRSGGVVARGGVFRNVLASGNTLEDGKTAVDWTCYGSPSATYCCSPSGLPAGEGNVSEAVAFKRNYVPARNSAAIDAGSVVGYEQYLVGGTDLLGKRRIVNGAVDIGCCENQQLGLMLMVR